MDDATIKFITSQNKELKDDFRKSIGDLATAVSSRVDDKIEIKMTDVHSKLDSIIKQNVIRNGRIEANEDDIKETRKETDLFRWMHRNPTKAIAVIVVIFGGLAYGYNKIDIRKGLENKGIYFKDTTKNIVERNPAR